jgi:hypothetical protein
MHRLASSADGSLERVMASHLSRPTVVSCTRKTNTSVTMRQAQIKLGRTQPTESLDASLRDEPSESLHARGGLARRQQGSQNLLRVDRLYRPDAP